MPTWNARPASPPALVKPPGALAAFGSAGQQGRILRDDVYMPITPMFHVHAWGVPHVPAVSEVAVIGVKDAKWGERPVALIVLKPDFLGGKIDAAAIQAHVKDYADKGLISKFGVPERIRFVDERDKTSVGKLKKKAMRDKYSGAGD